MFLLSAFYAFTREPYFTTLAISMALSLATVALLLWVSRHLSSHFCWPASFSSAQSFR
jgi:hypothetical protein